MALSLLASIFYQYLSLGDIFYRWEQLGFFDLILPFLLIFAVVYGILSYIQVFKENKAVPVIIALVMGFLSIRLPFFSAFLSEIAPRLGVGLAILLALLILVGLFTPHGSRHIIGWILMAVGVIIFIVIITQTADVLRGFGYGTGFVSGDLIAYVVLIVVLIGIIVAVVAGGRQAGPAVTVKKILAPLFGDRE